MNAVVLLSGGSGMRMRSNIPKQHIVLEDKQIIEYTLMAFSESDHVDSIYIVSNPEYSSYMQELKRSFTKVRQIVDGGITRIHSVKNAVEFLRDICKADDKIVFSDAVRPCVTLREISELFEQLDHYQAVTTGVEMYETVLKLKGTSIELIIQRDGIVRQTSLEGYVFSALKRLYLEAKESVINGYSNIGIDLLFSEGIPVGIVKSNPLNFKITTKEDLWLFESVLRHGFQEIIRQK